jgi:hypothetical protein
MSFRRRYGRGPIHALLVLASFTFALWALARVLGTLSDPIRFVVWFLGAIVAHDLILFPLYTLLGLVAGRTLTAPGPSRLRIAALNHLRVPVLLSGLLLLVWFPLILEESPAAYRRVSGMSTDVYLGRWLLLSAALFAGSALLFAVRVRGLRE